MKCLSLTFTAYHFQCLTFYDIEILRSRIDGVEALRDMRELREGHDALSTRVSSVEECVHLHHVQEFMHRVILIEERIGVSGGVIGETLRECQVRLDQCTAGLNLDNRMRTQDWYHCLSEHESSDENHQTADGRPKPRRAAPKRLLVARARVLLRELEPWFAQLRRESQAQGLDEDTIHQRMTSVLAEYWRREAMSSFVNWYIAL